MLENVGVVFSLFAHHGGAYLTESYAVAPTFAMEAETLRNAIGIDIKWLNVETAAQQVGVAEGAADFEFFADDILCLGANDTQSIDATALSSGERFELLYLSEVDAETLLE